MSRDINMELCPVDCISGVCRDVNNDHAKLCTGSHLDYAINGCNKSDGNVILVHLDRFKEAMDQHSDCTFILDRSYIEDDSDNEIKTAVECNSTEQPPTPNNTPVSPLQLGMT